MSKFRPPDDMRGRARGQIHLWRRTEQTATYTETVCFRCGLRRRIYEQATYRGGQIVLLLAVDDQIWRLAKGAGRCPER